jgi:hypothetical protein
MSEKKVFNSLDEYLENFKVEVGDDEELVMATAAFGDVLRMIRGNLNALLPTVVTLDGKKVVAIGVSDPRVGGAVSVVGILPLPSMNLGDPDGTPLDNEIVKPFAPSGDISKTDIYMALSEAVAKAKAEEQTEISFGGQRVPLSLAETSLEMMGQALNIGQA